MVRDIMFFEGSKSVAHKIATATIGTHATECTGAKMVPLRNVFHRQGPLPVPNPV